jgi:hypothetical protein
VLTHVRVRNVETVDVCHATGFFRLSSCGHEPSAFSNDCGPFPTLPDPWVCRQRVRNAQDGRTPPANA